MHGPRRWRAGRGWPTALTEVRRPPRGRGRGLPQPAPCVGVRVRPPALHGTRDAGRAPRLRVSGAQSPPAFRAVWSACTGAGRRPVPTWWSRRVQSRPGAAGATRRPGTARLKATPTPGARVCCCCCPAAPGMDARSFIGRSDGPDVGAALPAPLQVNGIWDFCFLFFSIKNWWHRPRGVGSRPGSRLLRWFGQPGEGACAFPGLSPLH